MEKLQFAQLIGYISFISHLTFTYDQIAEIDKLIIEGVHQSPTYSIKSILKHISVGNKIEAIKEYRSLFNVGLKEAKDAVEGLG
jgi:ribosomal protein L7/L12